MEKEKILQASAEEFMRLGIKSVSMDDISSKLGISKKTLYQSVENKADLVTQSISKRLTLEGQLLEDISANANDAIDEMIQMGHHRVLTLREMKPSVIHDLQKYYKSVWALVKEYGDKVFGGFFRANIKKGIEEGFYRPDIDPDIITKLFMVMSWSIVDETAFSVSEFKPDVLAREHMLYHLHGILSVKGKAHLNKYELF